MKPLMSDAIHIWHFPLAFEDYTAFPSNFLDDLRHKHLLNPDETLRAQRFYFTQHQQRFILARSFMRLLLGYYAQKPPDSLIFHETYYGKPLLLDSDLTFNLSHSGSSALLAIGRKHPIGIDIEYFSKRPLEGIAQKLFSPQEYDLFIQLIPSLKPFAFFHTWAQKEAFIKQSGLGLTYPTETFSVPILGAQHTEIYDKIHDTSLILQSFMPQPACCAAICHTTSVESITWHSLGNVPEFF